MIVKNIIDDFIYSNNNLNNETFIQSVSEMINSISPILKNSDYNKYSILKRILIPNREIKFKVTWLDDNNIIQVNNGYRIQFNNSLGPYKGGLRFHKSVNTGILKFLAFEQVFKNALTDLSIGGAKGGSNFDPKGKSDFEIIKFCQAFMQKLFKYIGETVDVPAGDIGVGKREIGYLFASYKKLTNMHAGTLTGKDISLGGSLGREEATGYGAVYFTVEMLIKSNLGSLDNKLCSVSGSGNVAIFTIDKIYQMGGKPITCSDSQGSIYDKNGIDLDILKSIKLKNKLSLSEYIKYRKDAKYIPIDEYKENSHFVWSIKVDCAFPSATQNELTILDAKNLIKNGAISITECANMPTTKEALDYILQSPILFAPAKAANSGGVIVSQLEMSQNSSMVKWSYEKINIILETKMKNIFHLIDETSEEYNLPKNYVDGANIASFKKVADAMIKEGY